MAFIRHSKLPRLEREWYCGRSAVFWNHAIAGRATSWLSSDFHPFFRELLLHTCARHHLACPVYVLMPDHLHLDWRGLTDQSHQLKATNFLREHLARRFGPASCKNRPMTTFCAKKNENAEPFVRPATASLKIRSRQSDRRLETLAIRRRDDRRLSRSRFPKLRFSGTLLENLRQTDRLIPPPQHRA